MKYFLTNYTIKIIKYEILPWFFIYFCFVVFLIVKSMRTAKDEKNKHVFRFSVFHLWNGISAVWLRLFMPFCNVNHGFTLIKKSKNSFEVHNYRYKVTFLLNIAALRTAIMSSPLPPRYTHTHANFSFLIIINFLYLLRKF